MSAVAVLLTVVVPVYNGGDDIVENVDAIHARVTERLPDERVELIVVSDGSIDGTAERLLESRGERRRVIHYDRNLGKGYAVKAGAIVGRGEWFALVDSDLDLDPSSIAEFLDVAQREQLDFAIGSKRHPDSVVRYPTSRRVASWSYQQLNRLLFRLDVRDTQVGLKVFHRRVVDDVMPLLLVKQFAFDLELLAVATALGHDRIAELPVRLDYRFTGSALRSRAVARALWDTAAVFYRLRVLRTYQRKRRLFGARPAEAPLVSVVGDHEAARALDYPALELAASPSAARGDVLAILGGGARPAGNWVSATIPFFADESVAAVVTPTVAPLQGPLRRRIAAAVLESRLGGGSRRSSFFPGNVRSVGDYPADSVVVRRADYDAGIPSDELVASLTARGRRVVYTPDASLSAAPPPLVRPHLQSVAQHGRTRARAARRTRGRSLSVATALSLAPLLAAIAGVVLLFAGGVARDVGRGLLLAYAVALVLSGLHAAVRFRSLLVGVLEPPAVVLTQFTYLAGFALGMRSSFASASPSRTFQSKRRA